MVNILFGIFNFFLVKNLNMHYSAPVTQVIIRGCLFTLGMRKPFWDFTTTVVAFFEIPCPLRINCVDCSIDSKPDILPFKLKMCISFWFYKGYFTGIYYLLVLWIFCSQIRQSNTVSIFFLFWMHTFFVLDIEYCWWLNEFFIPVLLNGVSWRFSKR